MSRCPKGFRRNTKSKKCLPKIVQEEIEKLDAFEQIEGGDVIQTDEKSLQTAKNAITGMVKLLKTARPYAILILCIAMSTKLQMSRDLGMKMASYALKGHKHVLDAWDVVSQHPGVVHFMEIGTRFTRQLPGAMASSAGAVSTSTKLTIAVCLKAFMIIEKTTSYLASLQFRYHMIRTGFGVGKSMFKKLTAVETQESNNGQHIKKSIA